MESSQYMQSQSSRIPMAIAGILSILPVVSRSSISILMPAWLDVLNNTTVNANTCNINSSNNQIDAYTIIFIYVVLCLTFFAFVLLVAKIWCSELVTQRECSYDKRKFAFIGVSDAIATLCFVYASSRCRTAPYLQALATNLALPITFIIRFVLLRKRPTCRKTLCALLVLFAGVTAQLPDIVLQLKGSNVKNVDGGADDIEGILWSLCLFFGFILMALVYVVMEDVMKSSVHSNNRCYMDTNGYVNIAYVLFWSYLFQLLTLILLFWTDIIPEVGMRNGVVDFANWFWFNVQCFFGQGCHRTVIVISSLCTIMLFMNKLVSSYFLRYLEGANYLVMVTSIQTPVVLLFFSLFDENPIVWHPHAYLSTWLSIAALCIMLPAIYIYDTGAPEPQPNSEPLQTVSEMEVQTDDLGPRSQQTQTEPATKISYNVQSHRVAIPNYMDDDVLMTYLVQAQAGAAAALLDNTTPLIPCSGSTPAPMEYASMVPYDRLDQHVYAQPPYTEPILIDDTTSLITF